MAGESALRLELHGKHWWTLLEHTWCCIESRCPTMVFFVNRDQLSVLLQYRYGTSLSVEGFVDRRLLSEAQGSSKPALLWRNSSTPTPTSLNLYDLNCLPQLLPGMRFGKRALRPRVQLLFCTEGYIRAALVGGIKVGRGHRTTNNTTPRPKILV